MSMNQRQSVGFTMLEMLVALSITIIMVLFIGEIFTTVKDAAASSIGTSRVLQHARIVGAQIEADAELMVPLTSGQDGFLIVVNREYPNVQISEDNPGTQTLFSDQLCFVRFRGDLEPVTPGNTNSISSSSDAPYVKIWYGHCRRTRPDGSDDADMGLFRDDPTNTIPGVNTYAINWVFGRQALFLDEDTTAKPQFVYALSARTEAEVDGYGSPVVTGVPDALYMGLTDVAGSFPVASTGPTTLTEIAADIQPPNESNAIKYVYVEQRLRVNPLPVYDPGNNRALDAWQMAQTHPFLVPHTLSIEVEVAGDFNSDNEIDSNANGVIWYSERNPGGVLSSAGSHPDNADAVYVWHSGDTVKPRLVRITYRVTDARGVVSSQAGIGRTFEQIIVVKQ